VHADQDVFKCGHVREQPDILKGPGDTARGHLIWPQRIGAKQAPTWAMHRLPLKLDLTFRRRVDASDNVEEGRLPSTIRPDQSLDGSTVNGQVDPIDGHQAGEPLGDAARDQHRIAVRLS
jgi:hypothetical protein